MKLRIRVRERERASAPLKGQTVCCGWVGVCVLMAGLFVS